ncbi:hypothetical protein Tco_1581689, partial [Tanacetum coccineum]
MWHNVANIPSFVPRATYVPAGSRNLPASVPAGSAFPAGSRTKPASVSAGLAIITNCTWMREDRELLLRPQQVVLGKLKGYICSGDPRTMENPHKNRDLGIVDSGCSRSMTGNKEKLVDFVKIVGGTENPHKNKDLGIVDSGCSRSMTGNKEKLDDFVKIVGGIVTFGGGDGIITGKGTIRTSKLNFENSFSLIVYGPTETSTPVVKPVHTDAPSLPLGHSLGSSEHSSRYPSPSDLANTMSSSSKMEDIHHHPDTGIFSSSSYD